MSLTNQDPTFTLRQAIVVRNQRDSPLLCLPSELQNKIYYFALGGHEIYRTSCRDQRRTLRCRPTHQQEWHLQPLTEIMGINLPLACSQIRCELGEYYPFTHNSFGATTSRGLVDMLEDLTIDQRNRIEVITTNYHHLSIWGLPIKRIDMAFYSLTRLKRDVLRDVDVMDESEREKTVRDFRTEMGDG